jgi:hypothetical protein
VILVGGVHCELLANSYIYNWGKVRNISPQYLYPVLTYPWTGSVSPIARIARPMTNFDAFLPSIVHTVLCLERNLERMLRSGLGWALPQTRSSA